jgi:hypothetical protein
MASALLQHPYVFISYPRVEEAFAKHLEQDLRAHGLLVWRDETNINPGTSDWEAAIRDAISHAYAVVLIASPSVIKSLNIKGELNLAKRYHPKSIYPIWIDGTNWSDCVPIDFINTQYIDMRNGKYAAGLNILIGILKRAQASSGKDDASIRSEPKSDEFSSRLTTYPVTSPGMQRSSLASRQPILLFIGTLLILVLILGGIFLGLQLNRGGTNPSTGSITTPLVSTTTSTGGIKTPNVPDPNIDPQGFYSWATSGQPVVTESFLGTSSLNWVTNGSCTLSNVGFQVSGTPDLFNVCFAQGKSYGNFAFQANMSISIGYGGGLSFRGDGHEQYNFFVNSDGTYLLAFGNANADRPLFQKTGSSFIQQSDTLTVIARGSDIYLYVNQHFLTHVSDTSAQSGEIGLLAAGASTVVFNNLKVWEL